MTPLALLLVSLAVVAASQPLVEPDSQKHHTYNYTQPAYCLLVSCSPMITGACSAHYALRKLLTLKKLLSEVWLAALPRVCCAEEHTKV